MEKPSEFGTIIKYRGGSGEFYGEFHVEMKRMSFAEDNDWDIPAGEHFVLGCITTSNLWGWGVMAWVIDNGKKIIAYNQP